MNPSSIIIDDPFTPAATIEKPVEVKMREVLAQPVTLLQDSVLIETSPGVNKCISYMEFLDTLKRCSGIVEAQVSSGFQMPRGCFYMSISSTNLYLNCYTEGGKRAFQYTADTSIKEVIAPNIITSYVLDKSGEEWTVRVVKYFATDLPINKLPQRFIESIDRRAGVYLLPFSNVYNDAKMCYGNNSMPSRIVKGDLRRLNYYYDFMWTTPFNNDLGMDGKVGNCPDIKGWYRRLNALSKTGGSFPYTDLYQYTPGLVPVTPVVTPAPVIDPEIVITMAEVEEEDEDDEFDRDDNDDDERDE